MYELEIENLTGLGRMGDTTTSHYKKFRSLKKAMQYAEKEYGDQIAWKSGGKESMCSGDLRWVMYTIRVIKFED